MSVCAFNSLPNREYSKLFNGAAFSSKSFSGKTYLPVKNSDLLTFPVHEYRFHAYVLAINVQSRFLFYSLPKIHCFLL